MQKKKRRRNKRKRRRVTQDTSQRLSNKVEQLHHTWRSLSALILCMFDCPPIVLLPCLGAPQPLGTVSQVSMGCTQTYGCCLIDLFNKYRYILLINIINFENMSLKEYTCPQPQKDYDKYIHYYNQVSKCKIITTMPASIQKKLPFMHQLSSLDGAQTDSPTLCQSRSPASGHWSGFTKETNTKMKNSDSALGL